MSHRRAVAAVATLLLVLTVAFTRGRTTVLPINIGTTVVIPAGAALGTNPAFQGANPRGEFIEHMFVAPDHLADFQIWVILQPNAPSIKPFNPVSSNIVDWHQFGLYQSGNLVTQDATITANLDTFVNVAYLPVDYQGDGLFVPAGSLPWFVVNTTPVGVPNNITINLQVTPV